MASRLARVDVIQCPIRQQPSQLDQLLNTQRHMPPRTLQLERQITDHGIGRSQGFTEVGEQAFGVDAVDHGEELSGCGISFRRFRFWLQVEVEGALGGFVEFLAAAVLCGDVGSVSGGLGVALNMVTLLWDGATKACR